MGGSSSVRGDQTIYHTDNMCFDGTDRGSPMAADGQLWIGATASNRADNGGHVRLGSLTAGTGITITNGPGTITVASTAATTDLHTAQIIVNSSGTVGTGANFTTITLAIAAAVSTGLKQTIFVMPGATGTYTENFTLPANINLTAFTSDSLTPNVTIIGNITCTDAGSRSISGIRLQTNGAAFLTLSGSAATVVNLIECYLNCADNTGITYSSSSGSSNLNLISCAGTLGLTSVTYWAHSSPGNLIVDKCDLFYGSASTVASTCSSGICRINFSKLNFGLSTSSTGRYLCLYCDIETLNSNIVALTTAGTGDSILLFTNLSSGTAAALSIGAGTTLDCSSINVNSTNTNAITGAGTIRVSGINFASGSSTLNNTTTQVPLVQSNDAITVKTPGAYPYTTVPQDALILVDSSSARSIVPLASPTTGQVHIIKDNVGSAATNNITVTPSGKNIDGAASYVINTNYGSINIAYNGTQWNIF